MSNQLSTPSQDAMAHISLWAGVLGEEDIDPEAFDKVLTLLVKGRRREHLIEVIKYLACEVAALLELQGELTGQSLEEVLSAEALAKARKEVAVP